MSYYSINFPQNKPNLYTMVGLKFNYGFKLEFKFDMKCISLLLAD
jgi:hypothetical protein